MKKGGVLFLFIISLNVQAQNDLSLFFRYAGGDNSFKMLWVPERWPDSIKGINVKRSKDGGDWVLLNDSPIIPATDSKSALSNVTNSLGKLKILEAKYDSLILNKKIPVMSAEEMYQSFLSDTVRIKFLKLLASIEYDFALIHGYAFYDQELSGKGEYTYGLFSVNKEGIESVQPPVYTIKWTYGETRIYDEKPVNILVKKYTGKKGALIRWSMETDPLEKYDIKGFFIDRIDSLGNKKRLNETLTRVNMIESETDLTYIDEDLDLSKNWKFEAIPINIFDEEGVPFKASYSAAEYPDITTLDLQLDPVNSEDSIVRLRWQIREEWILSIHEINVYRRKDVKSPPEKIAALEGKTTEYIDDMILSSGYYFYQIEIVTIHDEHFQSGEHMVYKQFIVRPQKPAGFTGSVITESSDTYVLLKWLPKQLKDTITVGYQLYSDGIMGDGLAKEGSMNAIEGNSYKFEINSRFGKKYHFAVSALSADYTESRLSDTLEVFVPSKSLPEVNIWPVTKEDNRVTLNWQYADFIEDLEGFRLYENGKLIVDEKVLDQSTRQWVSPTLEPGKYTYTLEAVTRYDVKSDLSKARNFTIEKQ